MSDPMFCRRCGSKLKTGSAFCTECGGSLADDGAPAATAAPGAAPSGAAPSGAAPSGAAPSGATPDLIRWRVEVALLTNRFIVRDVLLGALATTVISGTLIGGIFAWSGGWDGFRAGLIFAGIMGAFILLMSVLTLGVIFGNRWPLEFVLTNDGVIMNNVSEKAHAIHRLSWILAIVTGRPLMAGPGLLAQSREVVGIPWDEVRTVKHHAALGVIAITGGFLDNIRLYCTSGNYTDVARRVESLVRQHAPSATIS